MAKTRKSDVPEYCRPDNLVVGMKYRLCGGDSGAEPVGEVFTVTATVVTGEGVTHMSQFRTGKEPIAKATVRTDRGVQHLSVLNCVALEA